MALISNPPEQFPTPLAFDCTPSSLLASSPCLACLSKHEKIAVIVGIIAQALGKSVTEIMDASKCFTCQTESQMLQSLVTMLGNQLLGESDTIQDVMDKVNCLRCAPDRQLLAAIIYGLCQLSISPQT